MSRASAARSSGSTTSRFSPTAVCGLSLIHISSGPTAFENVLIREGRTTAEECAENSRKNIFIKAMLRTIKDRRYVVHGRWLEDDGVQICSNCGEEHEWADYRASWCYCCGAKMDLDEKEGDTE